MFRTCWEKCSFTQHPFVYKDQCLSSCPYSKELWCIERVDISNEVGFYQFCGRLEKCPPYFRINACYDPSQCESIDNLTPLYDYKLKKGICMSGPYCRKTGRIVYAENKYCTDQCPPSTIKVSRPCSEIVTPDSRYQMDHPLVQVPEAIDEVCYDNLMINCVEDLPDTTSLWMLVISLTVCVIHLALLIWIVSSVRKQTVTKKTWSITEVLEGWLQFSMANINSPKSG